MKQIIKFAACIFLLWVVIFISCKKEHSCEGCAEKNEPPIAVAGPDQVITLPTDSISLDGSGSNDPDGSISSFLWTKISGHASFIINNVPAAKAVVKNLAAGVYQFELKVTDNGGLSAKDTVQVIINDPEHPNHPPVANAGADQTITLPTNTATLKGSGSTDPDNNIISYAWTKISGPSFNIANGNAIQTQVSNLIQGIYQFELKVTDAGGLSAKDSVNVTVSYLASSDSISVVGCNTTMTPFEHLPSAGGVVHTAAAGNKILFVRYTDNGTVDIYDTTTHGWTTVSNMNSAYSHSYNDNATTIGNKIIFSAPNYTYGQNFNGQLINIYDASANAWTTNILPEGRGEGYTNAVIDSKVFYVGGYVVDSPYVSKKIDIYDASSNSWTSANFPNARVGMKAASIGNKILFAGGYITRYDSLVSVCDDYGNNCDSTPAVVASDKVDIWDVSTKTWSSAQLSEPRGIMATAVVENKIVFASGKNNSGNTSAKADIYDAATNSWSSANLSAMGNGVIGAYSVGNKVLVTYLVSDKIDIYDAANNSWSITQMPQSLASSAQERIKAAVIGNKIVFYTIFTTESDSRNVDMYDASTNTWCHALLSKRHVRAGVISYGGRIYIAGGYTDTNCCTYDTPLDMIWLFKF